MLARKIGLGPCRPYGSRVLGPRGSGSLSIQPSVHKGLRPQTFFLLELHTSKQYRFYDYHHDINEATPHEYPP